MIDNISPNLLKNGEIFDFDLAMNSYCFPVEDLITNNFKDFFEKKINGEFINLRKYYGKQEYQEVRNISHKLKSMYQMLGAIRLYKCLEQIQKAVDNNELNNLKQYYLSLVTEMNIFVNYPIETSLIETYEQLMKECDSNDNNLKSTEVKSSDTKNDLEKGNLEVDKYTNNNSCCVNNCIII